MLARLPERCFHEWLSQKLRPAAASNARKIRRRNPSLEHPRVLKPLWQERDSCEAMANDREQPMIVHLFRPAPTSPLRVGYDWCRATFVLVARRQVRSEEHTSELQSIMRISYAVFCLKKTQ